VGDTVYRTMLGADKFSPDYLLDKLDISSEHDALKMANRVEAAMYVWRRKASASHGKARWSKVKELAADDNDKNVALANRAESLLLCLKHRFPGLSQTTLDTSKIQYNKVICTYHIAISYSFHLKGKSMRPWQSNWMTQQQILLFLQDVGQAILESYSRVLESLAFNMVSWIDDVLFVDKSTINK
jgi:hypothetical protein